MGLDCVGEGHAIGMLKVLSRTKNLSLDQIEFTTDSHIFADPLIVYIYNKLNVLELGSLVSNC